MSRKTLWFESLLVTLLVFLALWLLFLLIHVSFKPLNYIAKTIEGINLNDLYFSSVANHTADTSIVIINIENLDRGQLNTLIGKAASASPAVLGIDIFFSHEIQTPYDGVLMETLLDHRDLIVMSLPLSDNGIPDPRFWHLPGIRYGHAGLLTNTSNTEVVREFQPVITNRKDTVRAFAIELAASLKPEAAAGMLRRKNQSELIHYIGNEQAFRFVSGPEMLRDTAFPLTILEDKTVLLGFCGGNLQNTSDRSDMFFTPVGFELDINRRPDMYGIAIHANILSMILHNRLITRVPTWLVLLLSFIITLFYIGLTAWMSVKWPLASDITNLLAQLTAFVLFLWGSFVLFSNLQVAFSVKYLLTCVVLSGSVLNVYIFVIARIRRYLPFRSVFLNHN